jgi:hypothetical protein
MGRMTAGGMGRRVADSRHNAPLYPVISSEMRETTMSHIDIAAQPSTDRDASLTRLIAGVRVPDTPLIAAAIEYAQQLSEPFLFNHAMRSWLFAETVG